MKHLLKGVLYMDKEFLRRANRVFMWLNLTLATVLALVGDPICFLNLGIAFINWLALQQPKED